MGHDTGQQIQQTSSEPWEPLQAPMQYGLRQARELYDQGPPAYYPGQTVPGFSPETEEAFSGITNRARAGSPLNRDANNYASSVLGGDYLREGNPHLEGLYNRSARGVTQQYQDSVVPSINSTFSMAGRYGSNQHQTSHSQAQDNLGRNLSELSSSIYAPAYEAERGRQQQVAGMAGQIAQGDYADFGRLADVGSAREGLQGQQNADQMNRYNYNANAPSQALERYLAMITGRGSGGGTTTQMTPTSRNRGADVAGGALGGYGLGGGWGALLGGLLGYM